MKALITVIFSASFFICKAQTTYDSVSTKTNADSLLQAKHNNKTLQAVVFATGYAGATYLCYHFFDDDIQRFAQANQNHVVTSFAKTYEYIGMGTSSIVITAGVAATSVLIKDKKLQKTAILLAAGHVVNDFVTNQLKVTFQRHRPNTGDAYNTFDWRGGPKINASFVSSHTSNAFATATAFATVYGDKKWVPVVAYSAASLVGLCRIYNDAH